MNNNQSWFPSGQMFGDFKPTTLRSTTDITTNDDVSGDTPQLEAGTFVAPEYDEKQVLKGQQKFAAPGIRRLREQVQVAQAQTYENPNVKAMSLREALRGYGSGLETTMSGAYSRAAADYYKRYQLQYQEQLTNFQAQEKAKLANFQAALGNWSQGGTTDTTTKTTKTTPYTTTRTPGTTAYY